METEFPSIATTGVSNTFNIYQILCMKDYSRDSNSTVTAMEVYSFNCEQYVLLIFSYFALYITKLYENN